MLPHLRNRPLAVHRYPDGIDAGSFFQQAAPAHTPSWIKQVTVPKEDGKIAHLLCQDEQTLTYLANQAAITIHSWLSQANRPDRPDQVLFDLDPPTGDFGEAAHAALALHDLLDELGLPSTVKTTGGRGLHVSVPILRRCDADELRDFARSVCAVLTSREPERYTGEIRKAKRGNRLYLDVSRNAYAQLIVAPYTVRAAPNARVAMPLDWSDLKDPGLTPDRFTLRSVTKLPADTDPWHNLPAPASSLGRARRLIGEVPGPSAGRSA